MLGNRRSETDWERWRQRCCKVISRWCKHTVIAPVQGHFQSKKKNSLYSFFGKKINIPPTGVLVFTLLTEKLGHECLLPIIHNA